MRSVEIIYDDEFKRCAKRLSKKYRSLSSDIRLLTARLSADPLLGVYLGYGGVRKVRLAIASKGGGKSGGGRVLTYVVERQAPDVYRVTLLTLYDKGECDNVANEYIESLVKKMKE